LAQDANEIATGQLGEILVAPAATDQLGEHQRIAIDAGQPFRGKVDAVEVAPMPT
jgi:hypothetical protein